MSTGCGQILPTRFSSLYLETARQANIFLSVHIKNEEPAKICFTLSEGMCCSVRDRACCCACGRKMPAWRRRFSGEVCAGSAGLSGNGLGTAWGRPGDVWGMPGGGGVPSSVARRQGPEKPQTRFREGPENDQRSSNEERCGALACAGGRRKARPLLPEDAALQERPSGLSFSNSKWGPCRKKPGRVAASLPQCRVS